AVGNEDLYHSHVEPLLAFDYSLTLKVHIARHRAHERAPGGAGDSGHALDGITVDLTGAYQWHLEVMLGAGIPFHEHVVGDDPQLYLCLPQAGPDRRVVVDMRQQRPLSPDLGAGGADPADGFAGYFRLQLPPVVVVRHQRQVFAGCLDFLDQGQQVVRVLVGDKALGPETQCLAADADGAHLIEYRTEQWLEAGSQVAGLHDKRIAAS